MLWNSYYYYLRGTPTNLTIPVYNTQTLILPLLEAVVFGNYVLLINLDGYAAVFFYQRISV